MSGVEKAYAIANNAIYFCDSSDYKTALYEVCHALKPDIDEEEHGKCYIEEQAQLDREREPETVWDALDRFECEGCKFEFEFWRKEPCFSCIRSHKSISHLTDAYAREQKEE